MTPAASWHRISTCRMARRLSRTRRTTLVFPSIRTACVLVLRSACAETRVSPSEMLGCCCRHPMLVPVPSAAAATPPRTLDDHNVDPVVVRSRRRLPNGEHLVVVVHRSSHAARRSRPLQRPGTLPARLRPERGEGGLTAPTGAGLGIWAGARRHLPKRHDRLPLERAAGGRTPRMFAGTKVSSRSRTKRSAPSERPSRPCAP